MQAEAIPKHVLPVGSRVHEREKRGQGALQGERKPAGQAEEGKVRRESASVALVVVRREPLSVEKNGEVTIVSVTAAAPDFAFYPLGSCCRWCLCCCCHRRRVLIRNCFAQQTPIYHEIRTNQVKMNQEIVSLAVPGDGDWSLVGPWG